MMAKINSLIIHQTLNYDKTGKMKIESGVYGMKPIKRLSGDIAYTQKQVIPSCLLTRGDELSEKTATTYSPTVTQYHRRDQA